MIQFNLLPNVKQDYLKAEKTRRIVVAVSALVALLALALMLLLFSVTQLQKKHLKDVSNDIKVESAQLAGQKDIGKILTVQNQLASLTGLHNSKPATTRLFTYLSQLVPTQMNANNLTIDFTQHTVTIGGTADSLSTVNKFVDTLKFTKYSVKDVDGSKPAFSDVVLSSFSLGEKQANYTVVFTYQQPIFDITQDVSLSVPNLVTTRSEVEKPNELFVPSTDTKKAGQ